MTISETNNFPFIAILSRKSLIELHFLREQVQQLIIDSVLV